MTWRNGRLELRAALAQDGGAAQRARKLLAGVHRVPGTGVFLASNASLVPSALIRNIEHNGVVHQRVIILNVEIAARRARIRCGACASRSLQPACTLITARFGFMETPDVAEALKACRARGLRCSPRTVRSSSAGTWYVRARAAARGAAAAAVRAHAAVQHAGGGVLPHAVP